LGEWLRQGDWLAVPSEKLPDVEASSGRVVASAPSLGQRAFGGAIWTFGQTVGSKVAAIAAQLVLAALLSQADFGRLAEVILIVSLAGLGQQLGTGEILIRRHRNFQKWVEIAFWINLAAGLIGAGVVIVLAPFAHLFFKDAQLAADTGLFRNLLLVAAIGLPFDALTVVAQAKLRIDLRFRTLALIGTGNVIGTALLSVAFASTRKIWPESPVGGAMSLVLPRPMISAAVMIVSFACSGFRLKMRPAFRRWWFVLRDSRYFFFTSFFNTLLMQGDYLLAGIFFSTEQLGAYYFAFNLSTQTVQLVSANLASVLLPSFSKLDKEPARQRAAYINVCSTLMLVGVILCLVQTVMAGPLLQLFFKHKWDEAIPLFQILTIGMIFVLPSAPAISLLQARGQYRKIMIWTIGVALTFLTAVALGATTGTTKGIAVGDTIFYVLFGPWGMILPLQDDKRHVFRALRRVYSFPLAAGGSAIVMALSVKYATEHLGVMASALLTALTACAVYFVFILAWRRDDLYSLAARALPFTGVRQRLV
jgi:O-antigen/teichoic acid export membrane protein